MEQQALPAGAEFFAADTIYGNQDGYTAPERTWQFDCRHVTDAPDRQKIAFGFVRLGREDVWTPTGFGHPEWEQVCWQTPPVSRHAEDPKG